MNGCKVHIVMEGKLLRIGFKLIRLRHGTSSSLKIKFGDYKKYNMRICNIYLALYMFFSRRVKVNWPIGGCLSYWASMSFWKINRFGMLLPPSRRAPGSTTSCKLQPHIRWLFSLQVKSHESFVSLLLELKGTYILRVLPWLPWGGFSQWKMVLGASVKENGELAKLNSITSWNLQTLAHKASKWNSSNGFKLNKSTIKVSRWETSFFFNFFQNCFKKVGGTKKWRKTTE